MPDKNINKSIAKGAIWMVALKFSIKGISVLSTMILARLLKPDDFGLMALASAVYAMVNIIREFGFDTALIQNQKANRSHYDTAWTMEVIFAITAASIITAVSDFTASFYGDERLSDVLKMMAVIILINGFNNIGVVEFRKKLSFNKEYLFQVLIKVSGFVVTIPLAWYWRSYWALLLGMLSSNITSLLLSYVMQNYRPKLSLVAVKDLFGFSFWLFLNNILYFINNYSQNFILAKFVGSKGLGVYSVSNEIATITTTEIIAPINRAAYPGYSKLSHNKDELKKTYLKTLSFIALIAFPSAFGIFGIAPFLVPVMLGKSWMDAVFIIQIIALASAFEALNTNSTYIYLALAKQKITTRLLCLRIFIYLPLLIILTMDYGVNGAVFAILLSSLLMFPISILRLNKVVDMKLRSVFLGIYRPLLSGAVMGFIVYEYTLQIKYYLYVEYDIVYLILGVVLGMLVFSFFLIFLWLLEGKKPGPESYLLNKIFKSVRKAR